MNVTCSINPYFFEEADTNKQCSSVPYFSQLKMLSLCFKCHATKLHGGRGQFYAPATSLPLHIDKSRTHTRGVTYTVKNNYAL